MKMRWYEKVFLAVVLGAWVCGCRQATAGTPQREYPMVCTVHDAGPIDPPDDRSVIYYGGGGRPHVACASVERWDCAPRGEGVKFDSTFFGMKWCRSGWVEHLSPKDGGQ